MTSDWLFSDVSLVIAGAMGTLLALPVLVWAVLWDWSRGRARCHRCWHSLEGVPASSVGSCICPECGKLIRTEKARYRRRIRVGWALAAIVVLTPSVIGCVWPLLSTRWIQMLPDRALIALMPMMQDHAGAATLTRGQLLNQEMWKRIGAGDLSERQLARTRTRAIRILERRSARDDIPLGVSIDDPMWRIVGQQPMITPSGLDEALEHLVSLRVSRSIHLRERWPRGTTPIAYYELDAILPSWVTFEIVALSRSAGAATVEGAAIDRRRYWNEMWWDWGWGIGTPDDDADAVVFDVLLTTYFRNPGEPVRDSLAWAGTVTRPFAWCDRMEDSMTALAGADRTAFEEALRAALADALAESPAHNQFQLDVRPFVDDDVSAAMTFVWRLADQPLWEVSAWHAPLIGPSRLDGQRWIGARADVYTLAADSPQWMLRVTGNVELALRHPTATHYWDGEIEVQVTGVTERDDSEGIPPPLRGG